MHRALAVLLILVATALPATAQRVALVIGNGAYREAPALANPAADVRGVAAALSRLGFVTDVQLDGTTIGWMTSSSPPNLQISADAVKNIGSSTAYVALCEARGLAPIGRARDLLGGLQRKFNSDTYARVRLQYQTSLHEKKQFTIAGQRWLEMKLDRESCNSVSQASLLMIDALSR